MMSDHPGQEKENHIAVPVSRRTFVGLALGAVGAFLAACRNGTVAPTLAPEATKAVQLPTRTTAPPTQTSIPPTVAPTDPPLPATATPTAAVSPTEPIASVSPTATAVPATYTPVPATPTNPPLPSATPAPTSPPVLTRTALITHWPETQSSRVVVVHHAGVWAGNEANPDIVAQMLDAGLATLTDTTDVVAVWKALFDPNEKVLLKVNCISYGGPTQPVVTYSVAQRLQDAGLQPENILIFDRRSDELESAGYTLNENGPGVRCHGSRGNGTAVALSQAKIRFYKEFDEVDAVINIPIPKQHGMAGISVALKNHYGSVDRPAALHGNSCDPAIAELNAQPNIQDKTRLIVGAALNVSPSNWDRPEKEDALILSFDPVALDTVARDILVRHREALGLSSGPVVDASRHLQTAQSLNLGATNVDLIDLREVVLG